MLICFNGILFSQNPNHSIYAEVNGYHVVIHEDNASQNCAFYPDFQNIVLDGTNLYWFQVDTAGPWANCSCLFNYSVEIDSLNAGNYQAFVYSVYENDTISQGFTEFTVTGNVPCDSELVLSSYASLCLTPVEDLSPDNVILNYQDGIITVKLTSSEKINNVTVSDLSGQIVYKTIEQAVGEIDLPVSQLRTGLYVVSIITNSGRFSRKMIIQE